MTLRGGPAARGSVFIRRIPLSFSFLPPHPAALNRDNAIAPDIIFSLSFKFRFVIIWLIFGE
ncbi:hypothetical protein [Burkholderia sp. BCC0405]|uniref:hypothetical protein n=1 Tax=Burkholderia sp. BCC0405 TaxID=2676298 RepID=UPI00158CB731|nr:hypothetical protein [Burkholderia sp. BCC0405]